MALSTQQIMARVHRIMHRPQPIEEEEAVVSGISGKTTGGRYRKYKDLCKRSPVSEYEYGVNYIRIRFGKAKYGYNPRRTYEWTWFFVGEKAVTKMKDLADHGCGLAAYLLYNPSIRKQCSRVF